MTSASPPRPRSGPERAAGTVTVRHARLDQHRTRLPALAASLSADERERAGRFRSAADAEAFVLRRGILRELLAGRLGVARGDVRFEYGRWGRPFLADGSSLTFNASSSGDVAVFALARGRAVGVDVERVRPLPDLHAVAARVFSAREAEELRASGSSLPAFFCGWTQKEAYVKALGDGFAAPLDAFSVPLGARPGEATVVGGHRLEVLDAPPGYAAAVAWR